MPVEVPVRIVGVEPVPLPRLTGHRCFACGTDNRSGLGMRFSMEDGSVRGDVTLRADHLDTAELQADMETLFEAMEEAVG